MSEDGETVYQFFINFPLLLILTCSHVAQVGLELEAVFLFLLLKS